ncbi:MAG: molybdopterin dinucleotide binding domain-containing protein [Propionibacteriaceae bacterium]|nr:molybdopterin dinucleotide binding domain-containing protein [Propionibacteriaceae bacterium]
MEKTREKLPTFPTVDELSQMGIFRVKNPAGTHVALKAFRADPDANPLKTPSGKIEIFSKRLYDLSLSWEFDDSVLGDRLTARPEFVTTWEGATEVEGSEFPLQCIGHHYKGRVHASYANDPWLQEAHRQTLWINPLDAEARGVRHADMVRVFNDRGVTEMEANLTPRIMPGVVSVPQGAWYKPDADGVDKGGCINTLTRDKPTPLAKGPALHTVLVEVEKI